MAIVRDVFICHASEDKEAVVKPLVNAFEGAGISCWYDEAEIRWGDSIPDKVNHGLMVSRYVVVVFSCAFLRKEWPKKEMNAALSSEASTGDVKVLPLVVGSAQERETIFDQLPLLRDKRYFQWPRDPQPVVDALLERLGKHMGEDKGDTKSSPGRFPGRIPVPRIKKQFSQRDKDQFLRDGFVFVRQYFEQGLQELEQQESRVNTDFDDIHRRKFVATIYISGEVLNKCMVWIGGLSSQEGIAYISGQRINIQSDSSFNDILSVEDDTHVLGFKPSAMLFNAPDSFKTDLLNLEQAAEYLWRCFTEAGV